MDKQLNFAVEQINQFKKRMVNTNLNLNKIQNDFPLSKSAYYKNKADFDGDSINELIIEYISFFNNNKVIVESKINKKQAPVHEIVPILVDMYSIYNELVNYADLMLVGKLQESIEKQHTFLNSKVFLNMLDLLPEPQAQSILNEGRILCALSILNYTKVLGEHPVYIKNLENIYHALNEAHKHGKLLSEQYQYVLLIEAYYHFITGKQRHAFLSLGLLFHEFMENTNHNDIQKIRSVVSLQFIGLGSKPYITMPLPQEFKRFVHYNLNNITQSKSDLLIEQKRIQNK